jgi:hypothetical protein
MSREAANHNLADWIEGFHQEGRKVSLVYFFKETQEEIAHLIPGHANVSWVNGLQPGIVPLYPASVVLFAETYPDETPETRLLEQPQMKEYAQKHRVVCFNAITDPVFLPFNPGRLLKMMQTLGVKEHEAIEHKMVTDSIHRAQQKITRKRRMAHFTNSRAEAIRILKK